MGQASKLGKQGELYKCGRSQHSPEDSPDVKQDTDTQSLKWGHTCRDYRLTGSPAREFPPSFPFFFTLLFLLVLVWGYWFGP